MHVGNHCVCCYDIRGTSLPTTERLRGAAQPAGRTLAGVITWPGGRMLMRVSHMTLRRGHLRRTGDRLRWLRTRDCLKREHALQGNIRHASRTGWMFSSLCTQDVPPPEHTLDACLRLVVPLRPLRLSTTEWPRSSRDLPSLSLTQTMRAS